VGAHTKTLKPMTVKFGTLSWS